MIYHDGIVVDSASGLPLAGARVLMVHTDSITGERVECGEARTGPKGRFAVRFPISGHPASRAHGTSLHIEAEGYEPFEEAKPLSLTSPGTRLTEDGVKVYLLGPREGAR